MNRLGRFVAAVLAAVASVVASGAALTNAANAAGGNPDTSCTSQAPCLVGSNTDGGPGVKGTSAHGNGLVGTTNAKGSTTSNGGYGILGEDLQKTTGTTNAGVRGTSLNGLGVTGLSTNGTGVFGTGANGVTGQVTATGGAAVLAIAPSTSMYYFRGNNSFQDQITIDNEGNIRTNGEIDAPTDLFGGPGAYGGTFGEGYAYGARGLETGNNAGFAVFAQTGDETGYLYTGFSNVRGAYTFLVTDSGDVFANSFNPLASASVLQKTSTGGAVKTFSHQTTQPSLEDFGEAQLVDGRSDVRLDPAFASVIDVGHDYIVVVTPEGDCRGLYVTQKTAGGFVVRELQGGRSSIPFSYRVVAKPYGAASSRLPSASKEMAEIAKLQHRGAPPIRKPK